MYRAWRSSRSCGRVERDDDRKLHPDLVPWEELPEEAREKDRMMVRDLPAFLAKAGFQVEKVSR